MEPLKEKSTNVRVTRSGGRTPKGPPPYQEENASASGQSKKIPVDPESESDYVEDVGDEELGDEDSDFEPEESSDTD